MERIYTMHTLHEDVAVDVQPPMMPEPRNTEWELAQAYVRPQPLEGIFSPEEGLRHGTAFPNLSQPYRGRMVVEPC